MRSRTTGRTLPAGVAMVLILVAGGCAPRVGHQVVTYPDGTPRWMVQLADDVPHGESRSFHPNGQLAIVGHYEHGSQHGHFTYFDEDGNVVATAVYVHGELEWRSSGPHEPAPAELVMTTPAAVRPILPSLEVEDRTHTYATLGRVGPRPRARVKLGAHRLVERAGGGSGRSLEISGQAMRGGFGGYGALWLSSLSPPDSDSLQGRVVAEAGGLHARRLGRFKLLGAAGIALPLARDDAEGFAAVSATMTDRLSDAIVAYPGSVAVRSSASLLGVDGRVYYRVEGGLDVALNTGRAEGLRMTRRAEVMARASAGAGVALTWAAIGAEVVNVAVLTGNPADRTSHSGALTGSLPALPVKPFASIAFPFLTSPEARALVLLVGVSYDMEAP
jgi:hypothetical protein